MLYQGNGLKIPIDYGGILELHEEPEREKEQMDKELYRSRRPRQEIRCIENDKEIARLLTAKLLVEGQKDVLRAGKWFVAEELAGLCQKCNKFALNKHIVYSREILDLWVYHVCGIGLSFRKYYEAYRTIANSKTRQFGNLFR